MNMAGSLALQVFQFTYVYENNQTYPGILYVKPLVEVPAAILPRLSIAMIPIVS